MIIYISHFQKRCRVHSEDREKRNVAIMKHHLTKKLSNKDNLKKSRFKS